MAHLKPSGLTWPCQDLLWNLILSRQLIVSSNQHPNQLYSLGYAQSFGRLKLHLELYVKFTSVWTLFWLANEEARERIGVDAVRGVGPLRMIRREVNCTAVASGLRGGWGANHLCVLQRLKVILSLQPHFCSPLYFVTDPPVGKLGCLPTVKNPENIPLICD